VADILDKFIGVYQTIKAPTPGEPEDLSGKEVSAAEVLDEKLEEKISSPEGSEELGSINEEVSQHILVCTTPSWIASTLRSSLLTTQKSSTVAWRIWVPVRESPA